MRSLRRLCVVGPFHGPSGYDHHVRAFVRELHRQGVRLQLIDVPDWSPARLAPAQRDPWFDDLDTEIDAPVVLHFTMPHHVHADPARANVNYTMFEATHVPARWIGHNLTHDLVIVPTASSRDAWTRSGMPPERIAVCPLGVDTAGFDGMAEPLPLVDAAGEAIGRFAVRFLNVSEIGPRKNLLGLLRAWLRATTAADDAVLILKLGAYAPGSRARFDAWLRQAQHEAGRKIEAAAPIHVITVIYADRDLPRLYATATHYLSLSHGEGWDQPMVEAASSDLRLIAPDHSAYQAYLDPTIATLIPAREASVDLSPSDPQASLFERGRWWDPDEDAAIAAIRAAIDGDDTPQASARSRIVREFTWEHAARRLQDILSRVPDSA
jgi:glycosyltransferase involved in cell wall biosynthesis